jgi:hypothetical protein
MTQHHQSLPGAAPLSHHTGAALLAFLTALVVLVIALYLFAASWLANLTVTEWRDAPAGSQLDIMFDEPAHPPWSW